MNRRKTCVTTAVTQTTNRFSVPEGIRAMTENSTATSAAAPMTDEDLFAKLDAMGIEHRTVEHEAAYTVDQAQHLRGELEGAHIKNLFLRDKKKNIWLVTVLEEREVDLKQLRGVLGAKGNLSFGSPDLLMEYRYPSREAASNLPSLDNAGDE